MIIICRMLSVGHLLHMQFYTAAKLQYLTVAEYATLHVVCFII